MDAQDFHQLKEYLKENLKLDTHTEPPRYGVGGNIKVQLTLEEEVISEVYLDIPKEY